MRDNVPRLRSDIYSFRISSSGAVELALLSTLLGYKRQDTDFFLLDRKKKKNENIILVMRHNEESATFYSIDISRREFARREEIATISSSSVPGERSLYTKRLPSAVYLIDSGDALVYLSERCDLTMCSDSIVHVVSLITGEEIERYSLENIRSARKSIIFHRPHNDKVLSLVEYFDVELEIPSTSKSRNYIIDRDKGTIDIKEKFQFPV